jgi:hypothetical protein
MVVLSQSVEFSATIHLQVQDIANENVDELPKLTEQLKSQITTLPQELRLELFIWIFMLMNTESKVTPLANQTSFIYHAHIPVVMLNFLHAIASGENENRGFLS